MTIYNEPPPGMCIVPDKDDITKVSNEYIYSLFLLFLLTFQKVHTNPTWFLIQFKH